MGSAQAVPSLSGEPGSGGDPGGDGGRQVGRADSPAQGQVTGDSDYS